MKLNRCARASRRPLTAVAVGSMVTSNFVAYGSGRFASGVKIRMVVPDQRNAPGTPGLTRKNGAITRAGMPAQRHHRLGEDDPYLVGFGEGRYLAGRPGAEDTK